MIAALPQIAIWDAIDIPGRPTRRPWGCPVGIWRAACKRWERRLVPHPLDAVPAVAARSRMRPWPISIGTPRREARKVVVRPVGECSPGFRRMVLDGSMPGMTWEEGVGVIRWVQ